MNEILWQPTQEQVQKSRMYGFLQAVNQEFSLDLKTYAELHAWSVKNLTAFWDFYNKFSGIKFHQDATEVLSSRKIPGARWFKGAKLNYAENLLTAPSDKLAIISKAEGKPLSRLTYGQLTEEVAKFANALKDTGLKPGDRIAGYLPNIPETVIAMLGASSLGVVWSSCSPDFGVQGVEDRFGQIEPKMLVCVDGYFYNGKRFSLLNTLNEIAKKVSSLEQIIVIPFLDSSFAKEKIHFHSVYTWDEFLQGKTTESFRFHPVPFDHPLFIMYSSGTTGLPKCIVHGTGGTLMQHHKEHALHTNIGPEDVVFYFTTCGWMMWNWLVSALAQQATIVLYEGCPAFPNLRVLWELIDDAKISIFGTSPKFLAQNQKEKICPKEIAHFPNLRVILSTGSPLVEENFHWVYQNVKADIQLSSICGGTDIISCFMLGNPILPVRAGEIQCLGLGMDVVALDENISPVLNRKGELACRSPAPSMPVCFWKDPQFNRYRQTYFEKLPGTWIHGDFIEIKDHGGVVVYGRSDATLNPGGVRIGTAEIYRIVENMEEILDSLVIGLEEEGDIQLILFVVIPGDVFFDESLVDKIRKTIRKAATPRHVPHEIYRVVQIPKTLNGKKVELTVLKIFKGLGIENESALANPDCLREYEGICSNRLVCKQDG